MYYGSNQGCTQVRKFCFFFFLAYPYGSMLYSTIPQVLDSLVIRVRVIHQSFALDEVSMPI